MGVFIVILVEYADLFSVVNESFSKVYGNWLCVILVIEGKLFLRDYSNDDDFIKMCLWYIILFEHVGKYLMCFRYGDVSV